MIATPTASARNSAVSHSNTGNEPTRRNGAAVAGRLTTELVPHAPDRHDILGMRRIASIFSRSRRTWTVTVLSSAMNSVPQTRSSNWSRVKT